MYKTFNYRYFLVFKTLDTVLCLMSCVSHTFKSPTVPPTRLTASTVWYVAFISPAVVQRFLWSKDGIALSPLLFLSETMFKWKASRMGKKDKSEKYSENKIFAKNSKNENTINNNER